MSVVINKEPGQRILELGGGDNPHPQSDCRVDVRQGPHTHFTQDFNQPLTGVGSDEFDAVLCFYCLEHIAYPNIPQFLRECLRAAKPGGKLVLTIPNTDAQIKWLQDHKQGWDGKGLFESASAVLYGSQDYPENTHKCYFNPVLIDNLLQEAGWVNILVQPHGERNTDLAVVAQKPVQPAAVIVQDSVAKPHETVIGGPVPVGLKTEAELMAEGVPFTVAHANSAEAVARAVELGITKQEPVPATPPLPPPEVLYDRDYFNGGARFGGYAREGYWDYPIHNVTTQHVLYRHPESVLEIGCARGYVLKRIQDAGIYGVGAEVSRHCYLTRVCEGVYQQNLCEAVWSSELTHVITTGQKIDLAYSVATLEHIPEKYLPVLLGNMAMVCKRGLHGIDFGEHDDGFDRSHCTLKSRQWWLETFAKYAPGWPVEIVDKEELERGTFPESVLKGDGKVKLNLGCCQTMFHHGWHNLDVLDLGQWAQQYGYLYNRCDLRAGLPYETGTVDLIFAHHMLEHFTYDEGLQFLRDCRRVLKPGGAMRLAVPDAGFLAALYHDGHKTDRPSYNGISCLADFAELNPTVAKAATDAQAYWELMHSGHSAAYDRQTLHHQLQEAGFVPVDAEFRKTTVQPVKQVLAECLEMSYGGISLFMDAVPRLESH